MRRMKFLHFFAAFLLSYLAGCRGYSDNYKNVDALLPSVSGQPVQTGLEGRVAIEPCCAGKYCWRFVPLFNYDVTALVFGVSRKFSSDFSDAMSDVGLLWGENASKRYYKDVKLRVMMDHYYVSWDAGENFNLSDAANTHIVTCDPAAFRKIGALKSGDQVRLRGWLVNAAISESPAEKDPSKIMTWNSSVTRNDTREGACELMYVRSAADVEILSEGPRFWLYLKWLGLAGMILSLAVKLVVFHFKSKKEALENAG